MRRVGLRVFGFFLILSVSAMASNQAGLVIRNSTGEVITRCVEFEEATITVDRLLQRSGFRLLTEPKSWGTSVKYIHDDGTPAGVTHPEGWFWNFYQHDGSNWVMSDTGVSSTNAAHGKLFGFVFGAWDAVKPPPKTFANVCEIVSKAGLVIDHSDGRRVVRAVEFFGETITGYQLLLKSKLPLVASEQSWGIGICSIDGEGMSAGQCFDDPLGRFWNFNILESDDSWMSSPVGTANAVVRDREVHGYFYTVWGAVQPPITRVEVFGLPSGVFEWTALR